MKSVYDFEDITKAMENLGYVLTTTTKELYRQGHDFVMYVGEDCCVYVNTVTEKFIVQNKKTKQFIATESSEAYAQQLWYRELYKAILNKELLISTT